MQPVFLEREENLQQLRDLEELVRRSGGRIAFVCGEAGIGKSTLIERYVSTLGSGQRQAMGLCDPLHAPRPLGPVQDMAFQLFGPVAEGTLEDACFGGFVQKLQAQPVPVVLVMEDLHWVDDRTLDWLKFLGRRIAALPVFLICSYREDEVGPDHGLRSAIGNIPAGRKTRMPLAPLSLDAIRKLDFANRYEPEKLLEVTGGNPFFLTEMAAETAPDGEMPLSVADALDARFNGLPAPVMRFLETVSCWPGVIPFACLQALDKEERLAGPELALQRHFLVDAGRGYKFRHELVRQAAYSRLLPHHKIAAHELFLKGLLALPEDPPLDMVVHHAQGAQREDILVEYAPRAARQAAGFGAHREAARYLEYAKDLVQQDQDEQAADILESWAYEAGLSQAIDEEVIAAQQAALAIWKKAGRAVRVGENLRWLSRFVWYRGEGELAEDYIRQAIEALEGEAPSAATAKAYALRAQFFMLQDLMEDAVLWGEKALAVELRFPDLETRAHALNTVGSAKLFRWDRDGEALLRDSLSLSLAHGFHEQAARVYTNLSECLIELRDLDAAETLLEEGIAFDLAHDLDSWTYYLIGRKAQLRFEQDRYDEAAAIARDVLEQENQTLLMRLPALLILARSLIRLGEAEGQEILQRALEGAEKIGEPQYLAAAWTAALELAVLSADEEAARDLHGKAGALGEDLLSPRKLGEWLFWSRLAGQTVAVDLARKAPDPFRRMLQGEAALAADQFSAEGAAYLSAWSLTLLKDAAFQQKADGIFSQIGAQAARKSLRRMIGGDRAGEVALPKLARGHYGAARRHPYGLTGKEQMVLRHLVDGKSNRAIADELSRSPRTVENHVASILSKLQAQSRLEVILKARNEPSLLAVQADA